MLAARAPIVVTLDGDGQNDPADAPRLVDRLAAGPPRLAMVGGVRVKRQDSLAKKLASRFANGVRQALLKDAAADTGCGLKALRREAFLRLPYFDHLHRFLPALMIREGYEIGVRAGGTPAAPGRPLEVHQPRPALGLALRPLRRDVAELAGPRSGRRSARRSGERGEHHRDDEQVEGAGEEGHGSSGETRLARR